MKKSILVMDQDFTFLNLYSFILPNDKFHVIKCSNYENVIGFIRSIKLDLIICDADKPHGCGNELLELLKLECINIPVIIVSGGFYPGNELVSKEAYAFLPKVQLVDTLGKLLSDDSEIWKLKSDTIKT